MHSLFLISLCSNKSFIAPYKTKPIDKIKQTIKTLNKLSNSINSNDKISPHFLLRALTLFVKIKPLGTSI